MAADMVCKCPRCGADIEVDSYLTCQDFSDYVSIAVVDRNTLGLTVYARCEECGVPVEAQYLMDTGEPDGVLPDGYEEVD